MNINFFENLVYGVFGSPLLFAVIVLGMFGWYAMKYDFSRNVLTTFLIIYGMAFGYLVGIWMLAVVLLLMLLIYLKEVVDFFRDR